jgi:hypothetical protein
MIVTAIPASGPDERSDIRDHSDTAPDFASLHPGYVRCFAQAAFAVFSGGAVSIARM